MVVLPQEDRVTSHFSSLLLLALLLGCSSKHPSEVVVYTSQDQVYAEPILQAFSRETGISVRAIYDGESVKTLGLVNRLRAEKNNPQCDLFWNNEEMLTRVLEQSGVLRETNAYVCVGSRTRRLIYNTEKLQSSQLPRSLLELTNANWKGRVVMPYPLFGTTASHFAALRGKWGDSVWEAWCRALAANQTMLVDGNSIAVKLVGNGEAWIGLTDSDDLAAGLESHLPIASAPLSSELLRIPNTIAVIKNCPHSLAAQKLLEYLQRKEVLDQLVAAHALEPAGLPKDLLALHNSKPVSDFNDTANRLKEIFLR
jgi:iron(III) transport system substrate-binding protein